MYTFKNKYTAIVCVNNKNVLSKDGKLMFNIKADLENFRSLTMGGVVIMGRKTFESLPKKPLEGRVNIILTKDSSYSISTDEAERFKDCYVCNSMEEVDNLCYALFQDRKLFVIGGGLVYNEFYMLGAMDEVILTVVNDDQDGDCYFPDVQNNKQYRVVFKTMSIRDHPNDNYYRYIFYKKNA